MSLELAFAKALADQPSTKLGSRVKRALRHVHASPDSGPQHTPSRTAQHLSYRWRQLGTRWASLRLGGCGWVGPIDRLRDEWQGLRNDLDRLCSEDQVELLRQLARGIGLHDDTMGSRERDYILRVAAALPTDQAVLCHVPGAPLFSPFTIFGAALDDLCEHNLAQRAAWRDHLADTAGENRACFETRLSTFCQMAATWLTLANAAPPPTHDGWRHVLTPTAPGSRW